MFFLRSPSGGVDSGNRRFWRDSPSPICIEHLINQNQELWNFADIYKQDVYLWSLLSGVLFEEGQCAFRYAGKLQISRDTTSDQFQPNRRPQKHLPKPAGSRDRSVVRDFLCPFDARYFLLPKRTKANYSFFRCSPSPKRSSFLLRVTFFLRLLQLVLLIHFICNDVYKDNIQGGPEIASYWNGGSAPFASALAVKIGK